MTIITLSNGKKVGNFSSPHPFVFEDGSILPAVSPEEAKRLKVNFYEYPIKEHEGDESGIPGDIELEFRLSRAVILEMNKWKQLQKDGQVDIVYCPLPMITAIKQEFARRYVIAGPFRAIRIEDRIKKLVSIHKQCI